jgi:hypothetical protein
MSAAWIFVVQQPWLRRRILAQQFLQRRFLLEPFGVGNVIGLRLSWADARRLRLACARLHVAFLRRRVKIDLPSHVAVRSSPFACFNTCRQWKLSFPLRTVR